MNYKNKKGFTLVEIIVVSVLLLILAGMGYAFFIFMIREKAETSAYLMAQMQSEVFVEEVARRTRGAALLSATVPASSSLTDIGSIHSDVVYFYKDGNTTTPEAGFRVVAVGGQLILQEWDGGASDNFKNFIATGNVPVAVEKSNSDGAFKLYYDDGANTLSSKRLEIDITIVTSAKYDNDNPHKLIVERGIFLCRT